MKSYTISNNASQISIDTSTVYIDEPEKITNSLASSKQAIHAVQSEIQSPVGMVFGSALSMAASCTQGLFDVACPGGGRSPTSLFILTIAESGERKTSTDAKFMRIVSDFEQEKNDGICLEPAAHKVEYDVWKSQRKAYQKLLDSAVDQGNEASILNHKTKLLAHYEKEPRTLFLRTAPCRLYWRALLIPLPMQFLTPAKEEFFLRGQIWAFFFVPIRCGMVEMSL